MSSYKKYVMMGITVVLLPLGKLVLQKVMSKLPEKSEQDSAVEENEEFTTTRRQFPRRA